MECNDAHLLLQFAGHQSGELDAVERADLETHLDECPECELRAISDANFDAVIGRAMTDVPVPAHLKSKLLANVGTKKSVRFRRYAIPAAAAALLLAIAAGAAAVWISLQRVDLDPETIRIGHGTMLFNDGVPNGLFLKVDAWLKAERGAHYSAPGKLRYDLLVDYKLVDLEGRQVPRIEFIDYESKDRLIVYVLGDETYDLASIRKKHVDESAYMHDVHVERWDNPTNPRVHYLGLFNKNIDNFVRKKE